MLLIHCSVVSFILLVMNRLLCKLDGRWQLFGCRRYALLDPRLRLDPFKGDPLFWIHGQEAF